MMRVQTLAHTARRNADETAIDIEPPLRDSDGCLKASEDIQVAPRCPFVKQLQPLHVRVHDRIQQRVWNPHVAIVLRTVLNHIDGKTATWSILCKTDVIDG